MEKDYLNSFVYSKRYLPHIQYKDTPIFITWRLAFPIPQQFYSLCNEKRRKHDLEVKSLTEEKKVESNYIFNKLLFDEFDSYLVKESQFPQILCTNNLSEHIKSTLIHDDGNLYDLLCYCIMPNHVHVLIKPLQDAHGEFSLISSILKSWKGISARLINKELGKTGTLWYDESYDHAVRNVKELNNIVMYILNNPVKAGLVSDWKMWKDNYVSKQVMSVEEEK